MQKKEIKAVLFDLDGVLVDSVDAWFHTFGDALESFGLEKLTRKKFAIYFGSPIEKDIEVFFKGKTVKEVKRAYEKCFARRQDSMRIFPDAMHVLKKLRKTGMKLGLVTNSTKSIAHGVLKHFNMKDYFDAIVTMDDAGKRKPAPDMVLKACRIMGVGPDESIMIGDTQNDMLAGKSAGCITVGFGTKGDCTINKLPEILSLLNDLKN